MTRAAVVCGLGAALPPGVVTNDDLSRHLDTTHDWIHSRTGISQRHVIDPGTATSDLAVQAGRHALTSAVEPISRIDMLILATTTPDHPLPATAPAVASRLGLTGAAALDVAAVCSGFVYALAMGAGAIAGRLADHVLIIGADTFTTLINPHDRDTAPLFGDGAGALILRGGRIEESGALLGFDLGSDGSHADLLQVPAGGSRQRSSRQPAGPTDHYFTMQGRAVYRHAITKMAESTRAVLKHTDWDITSLDWLVGHQANARILTAVAAALHMPPERAIIALNDVGNTSAASIPLALHHATTAGRIRPGHRLALTSFGGGLTWASTTLTWPDLLPTPLTPSAPEHTP